jgi:hypothetical protein
MDKQTVVRIVEFVERAFVPLVLGFLVFTTQQAQVRIGRLQTALAEQQAKMSAEEGQQNFDIECIKYFFNDISGDNQRRQRMAIAVLKLINDDLAEPLAEQIARDPTYSPDIRAEAETLGARIEARRLGGLAGYRVTIYYLTGNPKFETDARIYSSAAKTRSSADAVVMRPVSKDFFVSHDYSDGYQIRYEADTEMDAAQDLKAVLEAAKPDKEIRLETIRGRTPGSISVFVASKLSMVGLRNPISK